MTIRVCLGSGRLWGSGTGSPICPVCHRGPGWMGVAPPLRRKGRWTGSVPEHAPRYEALSKPGRADTVTIDDLLLGAIWCEGYEAQEDDPNGERLQVLAHWLRAEAVRREARRRHRNTQTTTTEENPS